MSTPGSLERYLISLVLGLLTNYLNIFLFLFFLLPTSTRLVPPGKSWKEVMLGLGVSLGLLLSRSGLVSTGRSPLTRCSMVLGVPTRYAVNFSPQMVPGASAN